MSTSLVPTPPGDNLPARETASTAVAAQATAAVQARYLVAERRPRILLDVETKVTAAMKIPACAEMAEYALPRWDSRQRKEVNIVGPTIRFAEECLRAMGNVYTEVMVVYDDEEKRILRVTVTDLETNWSIPRDVVVPKVMERGKLRAGQVPLARRTNSFGEDVFIVAIDETDLQHKVNALVSRVLRTDGLRLVPTWIKESALATARATMASSDKKDPTESLRRITGRFYSVGVTAEQLQDLLGKPLQAVNEADLVFLRGVYAALEQGDFTWAELMVIAKGGEEGEKVTRDGMAELRERLASLQAEKPKAEKPAEKPQETDAELQREDLELIREEQRPSKKGRDALREG